MKITHKLILSTVLSLSMIIVLGAGLRYGTQRIDDTFNDLVRFPIPSILRLSNMTEAFVLSVDEARSYRLYGSVDSKDAYFQSAEKFNVLMDELKRNLEYGTGNIPPEDVVLIDTISEKTRAVFSSIEADMEEYERKDEKRVPDMDPFRAQEDEVISLLGQYRDMEEEEIYEAREEIERTTGKMNMWLSVLAFIFVVVNLVVNGFLIRSITRPFAVLVSMATEFGNGDMSRRAQLSGKSELNVVANAFNTMADNIQRSQVDLEAQIQERTTKLKKQLDEMERMNELMIDREFKMIELKKQNQELKNALGSEKS